MAYTGFFHCLTSIVIDERPLALYAGFGALPLHYTVHFLLLRSARQLCDWVEDAADAHRARRAGGGGSSSQARKRSLNSDRSPPRMNLAEMDL